MRMHMEVKEITVFISDHRRKALALAAVALLLLWVGNAVAVQRTWKTEEVGQGVASAIAIDSSQNIHVVYVTNGAALMYGFRPAVSKQWFTTQILSSTHVTHNIFPRVVADKNNQPHVCVAIGTLEYITFKNGIWTNQEIDPNSGVLSYHCSIGVSNDGNPHIVWYHEFLPGGKQFTHARHADLENGTWVVRSIDGGISGKWNSLVIDPQGIAHVSYSQWQGAGDVRYATWNGKAWDIEALPRTKGVATYRGYDNSLALDEDGEPHVSFFDEKSLQYAERRGGKWSVEKVANISGDYDFYLGNTALLLDSDGTPHILYGDMGAIKHAFRNGEKWEVETIVSGAAGQYPLVDAVIGPDNTLYVCYSDPEDGRVKVTIGAVAPGSKETGQ